MTNCPNCGAPIEPYKCKCEYCGTWYFDFTAFDMSENKPYYVKFRTPYGVLTTLAQPELTAIEINSDTLDITDPYRNIVSKIFKNRTCDLNVIFHAINNPKNNTLYTLETNK